MNYLFLDSSPNKDQQLAFSRPASPKILDNMKEREDGRAITRIKGFSICTTNFRERASRYETN